MARKFILASSCFRDLLRGLVLSLVAMSSLAGRSEAGGVAEIADPSAFKQVLAISDVHGMFTPLKRLLTGAHVTDVDGHWAAGPTLLIVVGDSIDKGPDSLDVLDTWMRLSTESASVGGRVVALLGNHEAEFLAHPGEDAKAEELYRELRRKGLPLSELTDVDNSERARFLRSMLTAARVGRWLFCHAGYFPKLSWAEFASQASQLLSDAAYDDVFFLGPRSFLEAKGWWSNDETRRDLLTRLGAEGIDGVVFGHQPTALGVAGDLAVSDDGHFIKIDNGMAPEAGAHAGHLLQFSKPSELAQSQRPQMSSLGVDGVARELQSERFVLPEAAVSGE